MNPRPTDVQERLLNADRRWGLSPLPLPNLCLHALRSAIRDGSGHCKRSIPTAPTLGAPHQSCPSSASPGARAAPWPPLCESPLPPPPSRLALQKPPPAPAGAGATTAIIMDPGARVSGLAHAAGCRCGGNASNPANQPRPLSLPSHHSPLVLPLPLHARPAWRWGDWGGRAARLSCQRQLPGCLGRQPPPGPFAP